MSTSRAESGLCLLPLNVDLMHVFQDNLSQQVTIIEIYLDDEHTISDGLANNNKHNLSKQTVQTFDGMKAPEASNVPPSSNSSASAVLHSGSASNQQ